MNIEIISTGEEILTGSVVDTNSAYIAQALEENGYKIIRHTTTGDDYNALVDLFIESGKRSDITIVTGGLGPTTDDRSAEAAAKAAGCNLKQNDDAVISVENYFNKSDRTMSDSNKKQTFLPEVADCLENTSGTAPGFSLIIGKARFFFLPGVPDEMKEMFKNKAIIELAALAGGNNRKSLKKSLFLFGLSEAVVNERLKPIGDKFPGIITGFRADAPVIEIKIKLNLDNEIGKCSLANAEIIFSHAVEWVKKQVGDYVFSDSIGKIEFVVGKLLSENKKTLAVAESCTGGLIGHKLTGVPGSSDYFLTSCVTYANKTKIDILGVNPETLEKHGAVSKEVVREMAEGVRKISGADYAVATSGIAGPGGGSFEKPVGTVFIGIACEKETTSIEFKSPFRDRDKNKVIFCMKTLDLLRRIIKP